MSNQLTCINHKDDGHLDWVYKISFVLLKKQKQVKHTHLHKIGLDWKDQPCLPDTSDVDFDCFHGPERHLCEGKKNLSIVMINPSERVLVELWRSVTLEAN